MATRTPTIPQDILALAAAGLSAEPNIVSLCRRARTAGEQFGLDAQAALGLSAATYELTRALRELGAHGEVELGIGHGPTLQVMVRVYRPKSFEDSLTLVAARVRPMVRDVTISRTDSESSIRLAAPIAPASSGRPGAQSEGGVEEAAGDRMAIHQRSLEDVYAELQETNRGVVALYAEDDRADRLREAGDRLRLLLDSARDHATCTLTADGEIASWSAGTDRESRFGADPAPVR
jgi:hypothetical protein